MSIAPSTSDPPREPHLPVKQMDKMPLRSDEAGISDPPRESYTSDEISQPADFWNRSIMLTAIIAPFITGLLSDRFFNTERVLGVLFLLALLFLLLMLLLSSLYLKNRGSRILYSYLSISR